MTSYQRHTKKYELRNLYPFTCIQGPALYAYNNKKFTKEDWRGIRLVCDSIKVEDPMKVGRFGLGFKSVFHMTGKVNTFHVRERFSLLVTISGPEKVKKKSRAQSSPTSALRETT